MADLKQRRLFDIRTQHVSIVDRAANKRKFLLVKNNNKGELTMDEIKEVLQEIEKALNTLSADVAKLKAEKPADDGVTFEVTADKAGATISAANKAKLKSVRDLMNLLLDEHVADTTKADEQEMSPEAVAKAIATAVTTKTKTEKNPKVDETIVKSIASALAGILEENKPK